MDKITFLLFHCINKRSMVLFSCSEKLVMNTAEAKPSVGHFVLKSKPFPLPCKAAPSVIYLTPRYATGYCATHFQAWTAHKSTKSTHSGDTRGSLSIYTASSSNHLAYRLVRLRYNDTISQLRQMRVSRHNLYEHCILRKT